MMQIFDRAPIPTHTSSAPATRLDRLRQSTAGSWLAALLIVAVPFVAVNIVTKLFMADPSLRDLTNTIKALVLVLAYWAYVTTWECRPARELALTGALPEFLHGLLLGGTLLAGVVAVLAALGAYSVDAVGSLSGFAAVVASMLPKIAIGAFLEELVFRVLLLRLLQRSLGALGALAISSALFGLAHLGNVGASPAISVMLGIELGVLFGAAYLLTGRIWLCTAVHLAWNFAQGAVFSIPVSGQTGDGWLRATLTGPAWLTGGDFGVEGSCVSLVLCSAAAGILLLRAYRLGRLGTQHSLTT